jgi:4-amino-4-deoxy-L-arabinose transferase-like glycosyltransferase
VSRQYALAWALIRTAVCAYRAATQSFVADEAFTFNNFVAGTWRDLYFQYDANNHLLFSILSKISMSIFGDSEFALRLPSVIAGFFLMLGVWRVLAHVGSRAARWIAFAAIGLNPLVLDFSTAARGYGLAMALLVWALFMSMTKRYKTAGVLLGLAVSANFTAAFFAVGLLVACVLLGDGSFVRRLVRFIAMGVLAAVPVLLSCWGVLPLMHQSNFYVGYSALHDSMFDLIYKSILASPHAGLFGTWIVAYRLTFPALPMIIVFIGLASFIAWRRGNRTEVIPAVALGAAGAGMIGAHYAFGIKYPIDRTGLNLMVLFGVVWALAAGNTSNGPLRAANLLLGALLAIQFATQFHTSYFEVWWYDRSAKTIARIIEQEIRGKPPGSVSIGATEMHQPALEYYRVRDRLAALRPVQRAEVTLIAGQDYYVLNQSDPSFAAAREHTVLFSDPFAGVVLAK